jgi:hypothetical protein
MQLLLSAVRKAILVLPRFAYLTLCRSVQLLMLLASAASGNVRPVDDFA